jgi:hypothetical protein
VSAEQRCPSCGALVSADAEWCGQCFTPVRLADRSPDAPARPRAAVGLGERAGVSGTRGGIDVDEGRAAWTCPTCETRNPIEASACAACGTPFGHLLAEPVQRPEIEPRTAALWSALLPGLGHWMLGLRGDAIARFAVFGWSFGALLILTVSRLGKGLGATVPLFVLFAASTVAVWVTSVVDAYRAASGERPLVTSRVLLWASAAVILLSMVLASFVTLPAARG